MSDPYDITLEDLESMAKITNVAFKCLGRKDRVSVTFEDNQYCVALEFEDGTTRKKL